jgi:hypothetical protein
MTALKGHMPVIGGQMVALAVVLFIITCLAVDSIHLHYSTH